MTKDDIKRMAFEAGLIGGPVYAQGIEKFAALIAAHERNRLWTKKHWTEYERSITSAEREECAQIAENGLIGHTIAKAIRARGEK
jgi:hypothetical protein